MSHGTTARPRPDGSDGLSPKGASSGKANLEIACRQQRNEVMRNAAPIHLPNTYLAEWSGAPVANLRSPVLLLLLGRRRWGGAAPKSRDERGYGSDCLLLFWDSRRATRSDT